MPTIFGLRRFSIDRRPSNPQPTTGETSVSAPVLQTMIQPDSEGFPANAAHNRAMRDELYARVAEAAPGGDAKSHERNTSRGTLLPPECVERLPHPGYVGRASCRAKGCQYGKHSVV